MVRSPPALPPLRVLLVAAGLGVFAASCQRPPGWASPPGSGYTPAAAVPDRPVAAGGTDAGPGAEDADRRHDAVTDRCTPAAVLFDEVQYDPEGADGSGELEFIELLGPGDAALDGYVVEVVDGASGRTLAAVTLLDAADAQGRFVIGGSAVAAARAYFAAPLPNGPDLARLWSCDGTLLDEVRWGRFTDGSSHGNASAQALARCDVAPTGWWPSTATPGRPSGGAFRDGPCAAPASGDDAGSTARDAQDEDTSRDTGEPLDATGVPGEGAVDASACDPSAAAGVRIAEVLADPEGADTAQSEFFELIVPPGAGGSTVRAALWDGASGTMEGQGEVTLPPGAARVVVGGAEPEGIPLPFALQNGPDALVILDCAGGTIDGIAWGPGSAGLAAALGVDDGGTVRSGESLARCEDMGPAMPATPTPGRPNAGFRDASACEAACPPIEPDWILVNEVLFDPAGRDGAGELEFVEVLGPASAALAGWSLSGIDGGTGNRWLGPLALEGVFDADGVFVVGGSGVPHDQLLPGALQNGPDGLLVERCDGRSSDAVAWGAAGGSFVGEGTPAGTATEGSGLCRAPDARDTGDNAADFAPCLPTPGVR